MSALQNYHSAQPLGLLFSHSIHTFSTISTRSGIPTPTTVEASSNQHPIVIEVTRSSSIYDRSTITGSGDEALPYPLEAERLGTSQYGSDAGEPSSNSPQAIGIDQHISRKGWTWRTAFSALFEHSILREFKYILNPNIVYRRALGNGFPIPRYLSWLYSKGCRRFCSGSSGLAQRRSPTYQGTNTARRKQLRQSSEYANAQLAEKQNPRDWSEDQHVLRDIPKYVLDHAPLVHLFSGEKYWPCDIAEHLHHVSPELNYTLISGSSNTLNLTNLDELNQWSKGRFVYLTSNDNVERRPDWLGGEKNIPNITSESAQIDRLMNSPTNRDETAGNKKLDDVARREGWYEAGVIDPKDKHENLATLLKHTPLVPLQYTSVESPIDAAHCDQTQSRTMKHEFGGRSDAPAVLIVIDKGDGVVDAFWFYFYSFNLGNEVFNVRFGNHVGDWEHSMLRFKNGKPKAVYLSEHNFGDAYSYAAMEKRGKRVSYEQP